MQKNRPLCPSHQSLTFAGLNKNTKSHSICDIHPPNPRCHQCDFFPTTLSTFACDLCRIGTEVSFEFPSAFVDHPGWPSRWGTGKMKILFHSFPRISSNIFPPKRPQSIFSVFIPRRNVHCERRYDDRIVYSAIQMKTDWLID